MFCTHEDIQNTNDNAALEAVLVINYIYDKTV
jgi:hypothetical protein